MAFLKLTSPHAHTGGTTGNVMLVVLVATFPGILALISFFGLGSVTNIILCAGFCLAFEAGFLKLRNRPIAFYLRDFSALVTAVLLAISLPPYAPWWLILVGCFFAIVVAKHLYGGMGYNPFNPAMVAYVVLLISFPVEMTRWTVPFSLVADGYSLPGIIDTLSLVFLGADSINYIDAITSATPLDIVKQNQSLTMDGLYANEAILSAGKWAGDGWEWINFCFLIGGAFLLYKRIYSWHAPVGMLASLAVLSALFYDGGSSASLGSPIFHWLSGATMFGAFFIVTDPVTSAVSQKGRLIYGIGIGSLVFVIRSWGSYPDAIAFAVLLMNFAAPFIDYYTLPRTYGHKKANSGRIK
ncbi:MAG: electron transport complex protein RnfD [Flavobacteriales bacterium]|jgi:electron transport complex protein RnfD